ncbi:MAG: FHA domain-containing protein [Synergistaceae bacterium]|jgi:ribosomal protein L40E|nr:FHA domain-containing protein [Synergistaceae bacterium]
MSLIKLCPACGERNPVSEIICRVCRTNLSSLSPTADERAEKPDQTGKPTQPTQISEADAERTIVSRVLTLSRLSDGRVIHVMDGAELGRSGDTLQFFKEERTVSRRHARVNFSDGSWRLEDLGSTNGTWVNGRPIEPGRPCPLRAGDSVALSQTCEMRVIE